LNSKEVEYDAQLLIDMKNESFICLHSAYKEMVNSFPSCLIMYIVPSTAYSFYIQTWLGGAAWEGDFNLLFFPWGVRNPDIWGERHANHNTTTHAAYIRTYLPTYLPTYIYTYYTSTKHKCTHTRT